MENIQSNLVYLNMSSNLEAYFVMFSRNHQLIAHDYVVTQECRQGQWEYRLLSSND